MASLESESSTPGEHTLSNPAMAEMAANTPSHRPTHDRRGVSEVTTPMNIMGNTFELRDGQGSQGSQQLYPNTPAWTPADATPTGSWMERGSYMSTGRYGGGRLSYVPPHSTTRSRRHRASTPSIQMAQNAAMPSPSASPNGPRSGPSPTIPAGSSYIRRVMIRAFDDDMDDLEKSINFSPTTAPVEAQQSSSSVPASPRRRWRRRADDDEEQPLIPTMGVLPQNEPAEESRFSTLLQGILFGMINGVIILPVLVGFAHIIFRDPFFEPYIGSLTKLVFFSAAVHQAGFSIGSSLPFAIGQVQDAGLIFLSAMATSIVKICKDHDATDDEILATVLCTLAISTTTLGLALIVTGKLRLAALVQYIPLPVIGGYLAFIGIYCFEAGLGLMSGKQIQSFATWGQLFNHDSAILIAPGLLLGVAILLIIQRFRHFLVLPGCLIAIPVGFHLLLLATGTSLDEARKAYGTGWLSDNTDTGLFYHAWDHYQFAKVQWYAVPPQIPTWLAMYFVVAFSSSLDVAAIQMELGTPLDFNHELKTVGFANLFSGLTGGFTGSYIFSQTIFTMRTGLRTRAVGVTLLVFMLIAFSLPISILAFIPKFFFGAVLTFIAVDLLLEWLWHSRHLVHSSEYVIIVATFIAICFTSLELGMLIGFGLSVLQFLFLYAWTNVLHSLPNRSNVMRGFDQRRVLGQHTRCIIARGLEGYVFFGSAVRLLREVKRCVLVEKRRGELLLNQQPVGEGKGDANKKGNFVRLPEMLVDLDGVPPNGGTRSKQLLATRFLVLDFNRVTGVDATAARSLLSTLGQILRGFGVDFVVCSSSRSFKDLLVAHKVDCRVEPTLDAGLEWCEDQLLKELQPSMHPRRLTRNDVEIHDILAAYLSRSQTFERKMDDVDTDKLKSFFRLKQYDVGRPLFLEGDLADEIYFVKSGTVVLDKTPEATQVFGPPRSLRQRNSWMSTQINRFKTKFAPTVNEDRENLQIMQYDQGGIVGELDFFAVQPRSFTAITTSTLDTDQAEIYILTRREFRRMCKEEPGLASMLQNVVLKSLAMSASQKGKVL